MTSSFIHSAADFCPDGRPVFSNYIRDLPPEIIRSAVFSISVGGRITDGRAPHETTVAGCEGGKCSLASPLEGKSQSDDIRRAYG
jgi:hypothetical protein